MHYHLKHSMFGGMFLPIPVQNSHQVLWLYDVLMSCRYMQHKVGWGEATTTSVIINHAWQFLHYHRPDGKGGEWLPL